MFCWQIHLRKRIVQGCLCKSHFTAAGLFHSDFCCAHGEGATFRTGLLRALVAQEPVSCKLAIYSPSPSPICVYSYCRTREAGGLGGEGVNHASTESHKDHVIRRGHFLFQLLPCLWHLWDRNDAGCGARPGEKTGFFSNVFLNIFCSYGKTDVGETCCRICLESLTSEMPGPARC